MCKLSFEKCICLLYLIVILVVLICSGIPIDDLDMSKRYFGTSTSRSAGFFTRIYRTRSIQNADRLRHHRQLEARTRELRTQNRPIGHIEAIVFQNDSITSDFGSPMSLTKPARSQRSSGNSRHRPKCECQPEHFTMKAYKSDIVLLVKAQGIGGRLVERTNYTVKFSLIDANNSTIKMRDRVRDSFLLADCLLVPFAQEHPTRRGNCNKKRRGANSLVKANITVSQEYVLFLNISNKPGASKCFPVFPPEPLTPLTKRKRNKTVKLLEKVSEPEFHAKRNYKIRLRNKTIHVNHTNPMPEKKIKLICRVRGLPVPRISWRRNDVTLCNSSVYSIIPTVLEKKRIDHTIARSKLIIKQPRHEDFGEYECVAHGANSVDIGTIHVLKEHADGKHHSRPVATSTRTPFRATTIGTPCLPEKAGYCTNGKCYIDANNEMFCECNDGWAGERCLEKALRESPVSDNHQLNQGEGLSEPVHLNPRQNS